MPCQGKCDFCLVRVYPLMTGSCLRLIDSWITQLKAHGPSRTCNESKVEEKVPFQAPDDQLLHHGDFSSPFTIYITFIKAMIDSGLVGSADFHSSHPHGHEPESGRGATRAEDAQGTPTQSHV